MDDPSIFEGRREKVVQTPFGKVLKLWTLNWAQIKKNIVTFFRIIRTFGDI